MSVAARTGRPRAREASGTSRAISCSWSAFVCVLTTIGPEPRLFLASAYGFGIDIELAPDMVFFRYDDVPGVIGKVGTLFGTNGANIANMAVSRTRDGRRALMALSADEPPSEALIEEMHNVGFGDAIFIELGSR